MTSYENGPLEGTLATVQTIGAAEFKARCLDVLERLRTGQLERVIVTKRGKPVAELTPPKTDIDAQTIHGFMRGSVIIPDDVDLTDPALSEPFAAASGILHG